MKPMPPPPPLPPCGHPDCANTADPRWFAYCVSCRQLNMTCDGHVLGELDLPFCGAGTHPHDWNALIPQCRKCSTPSNALAERANRLLYKRRCSCGVPLFTWDEAYQHAGSC